MHLLGSGRRKIILAVTAGVFVLAVTLAIILLLNNDDIDTPSTQKISLETKLQEIAPVGAPDENYTAELSAFVEQTTDNREKARGYKTLADAYSIRGKAEEALSAYKKAKEFSQYADFSEEERATIESSIAVFEEQVNFTSSQPKEVEGGFKEPNE